MMLDDPDGLLNITLIADEMDYKEYFIDQYITWLIENDAEDPLRKRRMIDGYAEINYFQDRKHELIDEGEKRMIVLENEQARTVAKQLAQAKQDIGSGRSVDVLAQQQSQLEQPYEQRSIQIGRRIATLLQQCDDRIARAKARLESNGSLGSTLPQA